MHAFLLLSPIFKLTFDYLNINLFERKKRQDLGIGKQMLSVNISFSDYYKHHALRTTEEPDPNSDARLPTSDSNCFLIENVNNNKYITTSWQMKRNMPYTCLIAQLN